MADASEARMSYVLIWREGKQAERRRYLQTINAFGTSSQLVLQTRPINHVTPVVELEV